MNNDKFVTEKEVYKILDDRENGNFWLGVTILSIVFCILCIIIAVMVQNHWEAELVRECLEKHPTESCRYLL